MLDKIDQAVQPFRLQQMLDRIAVHQLEGGFFRREIVTRAYCIAAGAFALTETCYKAGYGLGLATVLALKKIIVITLNIGALSQLFFLNFVWNNYIAVAPSQQVMRSFVFSALFIKFPRATWNALDRAVTLWLALPENAVYLADLAGGIEKNTQWINGRNTVHMLTQTALLFANALWTVSVGFCSPQLALDKQLDFELLGYTQRHSTLLPPKKSLASRIRQGINNRVYTLISLAAIIGITQLYRVDVIGSILGGIRGVVSRITPTGSSTPEELDRLYGTAKMNLESARLNALAAKMNFCLQQPQISMCSELQASSLGINPR